MRRPQGGGSLKKEKLRLNPLHNINIIINGPIDSISIEPVIWAWPVGPARFHANPRRAGPAVLVEK